MVYGDAQHACPQLSIIIWNIDCVREVWLCKLKPDAGADVFNLRYFQGVAEGNFDACKKNSDKIYKYFLIKVIITAIINQTMVSLKGKYMKYYI